MVEAKFRYFVIILSKAYLKMYLNHLHLTLSLDISDINWHAALIIGCFESSLKTFFKHGELQDKIPLVTFQYFKHHFQMSSQSQRHIQNSNVDKVKVTQQIKNTAWDLSTLCPKPILPLCGILFWEHYSTEMVIYLWSCSSNDFSLFFLPPLTCTQMKELSHLLSYLFHTNERHGPFS